MGRTADMSPGTLLGQVIKGSRLPFVTVSLLPVVFTAFWAWSYYGVFSLKLFIMMCSAAVFFHLGANSLNDFSDWDRSDKENSHAGPFNGGSRNRPDNVLSKQTFLAMAVVFFLIGVGITVWISVSGRPYAGVLAGMGILTGVLYSVPPVSLQSRGWGELMIFLGFGPLLSFASGYVFTGLIEAEFLGIGIPNGLLTAFILWVNEFPDHEADMEAGKRNLVVRLTPERAIWGPVALEVMFYSCVVCFVVIGMLPVVSLILMLLIPWSITSLRTFMKQYNNPAEIRPVQKQAVVSHVLKMSVLTVVSGLSVFLN